MKNKFTIFLVLLLALTLGIQPTIAKKPLTTITFDEVPSQGFVTLYVNGVTFEYDTLGAVAAVDFGDICPGGQDGITYLQGKCLTGQTAGQLILTFDKPTTLIEFGFALATIEPVTDAVIVDLYSPGLGKLRETIIASATPLPLTAEGLFSYSGPAVNRVVINFAEGPGFASFSLDNLVFHG